jgi:hypothetical protein
MMGDQSQSKRGDVEPKIFPCRLDGHCERRAPDLALLPGRRATVAARSTERAPWVSSMRSYLSRQILQKNESN